MRGAVLVCGGRDFADMDLLCRTLDSMAARPSGVPAVVHGDQRGADRMAGEWARVRGRPEVRVPANWDWLGRRGGALRNTWMLDFCRVDHVVAFPGGAGTADMVAKARRRGIKVIEVGGDGTWRSGR